LATDSSDDVQVDFPVTSLVLPSLNVPVACICCVPDGASETFCGPIASEVSVGLTKKPVQLTASAKVASAAKAPASRSFCLVDDIVI